jgi:hypothetical protein
MVREARKETPKNYQWQEIVETFLLICECPQYRDDGGATQMGKALQSALSAAYHAG